MPLAALADTQKEEMTMNSYENELISYECDLTAEHDRLKQINKELLEALKLIAYGTDGPMTARAAIAKAEGNPRDRETGEI